MKILFVVYHDLNIEARSKETLEALKKLGDVSLVTFAIPSNEETVDINVSFYSKFLPGIRYLLFLSKAKRVMRKVKPDMIVLHDCSLLIPYIKNKFPKSIIVYDQSELYIDRKPKSIKGLVLKMIDKIDKKYIKYSDITISANKERAEIMKGYYDLNKQPIVFDNMHRIDDEYNVGELDEKYGKYFKFDSFYIVYAGGIHERRKTYELIRAVGTLGHKYRLIIAGSAPEGLSKFNRVLNENNFENINYVGFIPRSEWKYLLNKANISVVAFAMDVVNNIYCASGKMYESLFEGTPILTSENPPLKRICSEFSVGVSRSSFTEGILELESKFKFFKKNSLNFKNLVDYEGRIERLANEIYAQSLKL
jgi:hypothetical protein